MNVDDIKESITKAFSDCLGIDALSAESMLPPALSSGKIYEAFILMEVCLCLYGLEGCILTLRGGSKLVLKTSPGPINRNYPWIEVSRDGKVIAEIFTDVEFLSMSYCRTGGPLTRGDYHEIDIALVEPEATGRPHYNQILVAVECKNTTFQKSMLKEILGIRRELSLLSHPKATMFTTWPAQQVPADPPSCVIVYSSSPQVAHYEAPGKTFGITFALKELV